MSQLNWARVEAVFAEATEQTAPARLAFLQKACAGDSELLREVEELLCAHDASGPLDPSPAGPGVTTPQASLAAGSSVGAWRIAQLLGRGGMGEVYAATRIDESFSQRAALKLLRADAAGQLDRFHAERQILAKLEHSGIARLLDGGIATDGRPFTVIEFVEGVSLRSYCKARQSPLAERLSLFLQICDAVAFAHRNLVIHRDLKPDNTLVDANGKVKLLDFGIAKLLEATNAAGTAEATVAPFTLDYAAPEQISGGQITTATDIYALGVLLFELLTEARPLQTQGLPSLVAMQMVLERAPGIPSRTAALSAAAPVPAYLLAGDLDAIIAKCLRKEPSHRYPTVNALEQDIHLHLRHEPVQARSGARLYVARRFVRRHWLALGTTLALIATLSAAAWYTQQARQRTERALQSADAVRGFLVDLFQQNDPEAGNGRAMSARELVDVGARRIESSFADADTRIELLGVTGTLYRSLGEVQRSRALFTQRLEQAQRAYSANDPRLIEAQLDMARAALSAEQFDDAKALLDKALRAAGAPGFAFLGFNTAPPTLLLPLRMRALLDLAQLESDRDNHERAILTIDEAIALGLSAASTPKAQLIEAYRLRGASIFRSGRIADAEPPLRAALAELDTDLAATPSNPNHETNLRARLEVRELLGTVLTSLGRFEEALPLLRANVELTRALLGENHPALATAVHQLASALRQSGDNSAAIPAFQKALALYEQNYGQEHSYVATALTGLGQTLSANGAHAEAIDALARAHRIYLRSLGATHVFTAVSATALADAELKAGHLDIAQAGFRDALVSFKSVGDGLHIYAEAARLGLGKTLIQSKRYAAAEVALRAAHARFLAAFGPADRRTIDAAMGIVQCLIATGRRDAAISMIEDSERALAGVKSGPAHARVAAARRELLQP